ncbi:MAG: anaerobic ribonucleoside-triphosphate reductase activating protein [Bacteroidales bacterium]
MLKYFNFDIVFREVPDEVTLAINFSLCPNRCEGCHSPWLWEDRGEVLDEQSLTNLINTYKGNFTCLAFMGGDNDPKEVNRLAKFVKEEFENIKVAWYSGKDELSKEIKEQNFDYIKIGSYKKEYGGLDNKKTNQRFVKIFPNGEKQDITYRFLKE